MIKIVLKEDTHQYFYGEQELKSVTKFVKGFFPKFKEKEIAKRVAKKRREAGELNSKDKPITARDVKKEWKFKRDKASAEGSLSHYEIEAYLKNPDDITLPVFTPKAQQAIKWFYKSPLVTKNITAEEKIYDLELGLAGTIDLLCAEGQKVWLVDWKTSRQITKKGFGKGVSGLPNANYYHYNLQLSVYAYMLERQGYEIQDLLLVHLMEDDVHIYNMDYRKDIVEEMLEKND